MTHDMNISGEELDKIRMNIDYKVMDGMMVPFTS